MEIETALNIYGKPYKVLRAKYAKGKKFFVANGWVQCPNNMYMQNGTEYAHFNSISKVWFIE